jgi:hypothetical protein
MLISTRSELEARAIYAVMITASSQPMPTPPVLFGNHGTEEAQCGNRIDRFFVTI